MGGEESFDWGVEGRSKPAFLLLLHIVPLTAISGSRLTMRLGCLVRDPGVGCILAVEGTVWIVVLVIPHLGQSIASDSSCKS